ncbi:MAG: aminotransferase class V-fold PLP-dependent enzyme [Candidatus Aminicenantes bacterium]|nr:aminotransferase class V-fold PLP-dependent enzyme [Candidatus Aminicenantes bacterium]
MQEEKLLLIPGPTPVHPRIINRLSLPTISHVSPVFVREFKDALKNLKKIVFCEAGESFIVAGAGTLSMEMTLVNLLNQKEKALVLSQGYFGQRMKEISSAFGFECDIIQSPLGRAVQPEQVKEQIDKQDYALVLSTHVDTATGACAPIKEYAQVVKNKDILFAVDGVCATGGIEEKMTDWGVDVILTAAQKCFGVPPGLAVMVFSDRAMDKRKSLSFVPAYYGDLMKWLPIMKDPSKYFSTPCVNEIRAFCEGTRVMLDETMEVRFKRHQKTARAIRAGLESLGFSFFTEDKYFADTITVPIYPHGVRDDEFRTKLAEKRVLFAGGLGRLKGKVFRIGHMGNISYSQIEFAMDAVEKALSEIGYEFDKGSGLKAVKQVLQ